MADRQVTHAHRNEDGDILAVCWKGSAGLMYSARGDVIIDVESGAHGYFVAEEAPPVGPRQDSKRREVHRNRG